MQVPAQHPAIKVTWLDELKSILKSPVVTVCVGNPIKGDDGAGPAIYQRIKDKTSARVFDTGTVPENYIQRIVKLAPRTVLIIDAVDFGAAAGEVKLFRSTDIPSVAISTHVLSLRMFAELIERECRAEIYLLGVQPQSITIGEPLTPAVQAAVTTIAQSLITHLA